ncbi:SIR2 family NAD-dependent protein deacylase [Arthrobacter sp. TB 26]|uniref:SIR2 family NAD-dependent protein deacylase n=1 Tax=Arthrobacter sp. TB 26 TaxID=494420 RepID=UPI0004022187|nr:SIR2 family protein [Arthrobacter sp. TB 26]
MSEMESLALAFSEVQATLIVGTGLSISCSENAQTASWLGLLEQSIYWAKDNAPGVTATWMATVKGNLQAAKDEGDTSLLLAAAGLISSKIGAQGEQSVANWLSALVGSLKPLDPSWPMALDALKCPILTTNYDTLIEQTTGRPSADWTEPAELHKVISRRSPAVGHLHGVWSRADSVVLSESDYQRALSSAPLQALQQAASSVRSLIYVGVGDGLADPNFSRLLQWHRQTFVTSAVTHFRLCRDSELPRLRQIHAGDNITPVSYGANYSDLPDFLDQFKPQIGAAVVVQNRVELARDVLASRVRKGTILCENAADVGEKTIDQLIAPPVLQPLSSEQARAAQTSALAEKRQIERSDPREVASGRGVTIIAGHGGSGRTTALYWLLEEAARSSGRIPLLVASKDLHKGGRPLITALKERAREVGLSVSRNESFPDLIIGIDDLSPYTTTICQQTIKDIKGLDESSIFITCQEGYEAELSKLLLDYGIPSEIQYIGELWRSDIRGLLDLVSPARSKTIEDNVVSILQQHHLPRTPFTISLLISVLLGGKMVPANSSHTTLLDLYLNQLIGRGDFEEDSRWGMDSDLRAAVLADLAQYFIEEESGSVPEGEVTTRVAAFFSARGIPESAGDLLAELRERKVLQHEGGNISFSHSSYLYVFAAKAATKNRELRGRMLENPLLYAPILKHYPSLERADKDFLLALEGFFSHLNEGVHSSQSLHARVTQIDAPDDLEERLLTLEPEEEPSDLREIEAPEDGRDDLEMYPRRDGKVALLTLPNELPDFHRFAIGLDVISTALRDSVLIADPDMKARILGSVLIGWGKLGSVFADDPELVEALKRTLDQMTNTIDVPEERREAFVRVLAGISPVLLMSGGVSSSLSTTRLVAALEDALDKNDLAADIDGAIGAAILLLDVQPPGWVRRLEQVAERHKELRIMADSIKLICMSAYMSRMGRVDDSHRLLRLISDLEASRIRFKKDSIRHSFRTAYEQQIESTMKNLKFRAIDDPSLP